MADHLLSTAVHRDTMPGNYARPESQHPRLAEVVSGQRIPVVDLACPDRAALVAAIGGACRSHGFFQVLNHGIDAGLIAAAMAVEEKALLYSDDPGSFNVRKDTVHDWRDYLRLHGHQFVPDWPSSPPDFEETMSTYCKEVRELGFRLSAAMSGSLGRDAAAYLNPTVGEHEQHMDMAVRFYPTCPDGLPTHTDPDALTILLVDQHVAGLQVLDAGKWVAVDPPPPGALIVSIGDTLTRSSLHAVQVRVENSAGANAGDPIPPESLASGEDDGRGHRGGRGNISAFVGIVVASTAVHAVAVGGITPVVALGFAVAMFAGVSMAMASII